MGVAGTSDVFAAFGHPDPDYDGVCFAVRNLGFIKFEVIRQSIVEIELHPRNVELPALLAVQQQLLSSDLRLFPYQVFRHEPGIPKSLPRPSSTISRLSELCRPHFMPPTHDVSLLSRKISACCFQDEPNIPRVMAQKWRVSFGHFDPNIIPLAMRNDLPPRLAIVGVKPRQQDPVWRFIGQGHRWLGGRVPPHDCSATRSRIFPTRITANGPAASTGGRRRLGRPRYDLVSTSVQYLGAPSKPWLPGPLREVAAALENAIGRNFRHPVFQDGRRGRHCEADMTWAGVTFDNSEVLVRKFEMSS